MYKFLLVFLLTLPAPNSMADDGKIEGLYGRSTGYTTELVELKNGKVRYWFYGDVSSGNEPAMPVAGTYTMKGDKLNLNLPYVIGAVRYFRKINGVRVLVRDDSLAQFEQKQELNDYGILEFIENPPRNIENISDVNIPKDMCRLYDEEAIRTLDNKLSVKLKDGKIIRGFEINCGHISGQNKTRDADATK